MSLPIVLSLSHICTAEQWLSNEPVYQELRSLVVSMDRIADAFETRH